MLIGNHKAELNFDLVEEIGHEGRNSKVYLAHDKQLDGLIVVKKINKNEFINADEYFRESKILYASSNNNVVGVNYGCSDAEHIFIAMPYYKNGSLKKLIDSRFLTVREVIRYSIQFLSGLHNIHSKGLIHFDVKPDNILLSDSNEALLSDFGLSMAMDKNGFAIQQKVYDRQVPPEVFEAEEKTLHYDIYLAGLTIYRLLNGNEHFVKQFAFENIESYRNAIIGGKFPNRKSYLPHIPTKLQKIVNKALNVRIIDRHKNVLELINELGTINVNLDWYYSNKDNIGRWKKDSVDKEYQIQLDRSNPNNITLNTQKRMKESGICTKVHEFCSTNIGPKYSELLKSAFLKL